VTELCAKVANPRAGGAGFESRQRQEKIFLSERWKRGLGPIQIPVQYLTEFFPGGKADLSLSYSAEVKNEWRCTYASPLCLHGMDKEKIFL
jgi:hypothetical protein